MNRHLTAVIALATFAAMTLPAQAAEPARQAALNPSSGLAEARTDGVAPTAAHLNQLKRELRIEARGALSATVANAFDTALTGSSVETD